MPGRHVTDQQMRLFMKLTQNHSIETAAAKAGMSRATGYRRAAIFPKQWKTSLRADLNSRCTG